MADSVDSNEKNGPIACRLNKNDKSTSCKSYEENPVQEFSMIKNNPDQHSEGFVSPIDEVTNENPSVGLNEIINLTPSNLQNCNHISLKTCSFSKGSASESKV